MLQTILVAHAQSPIKALSNTYSVDDQYAYFMGDRILDADPKTFELIKIEYPFGSRWAYTHYAKDQKHFYINGKIVYGIKPNHLMWLRDGWFKDDEFVIFNGYPVFDFNPLEFEIIDAYFLKNNKDIYYYLLPAYDSTKDAPEYKMIDNIKAPQHFFPLHGRYYQDLTTIYYLSFHDKEAILIETEADIDSFQYKEIVSDSYQQEYEYWDNKGKISNGERHE